MERQDYGVSWARRPEDKDLDVMWRVARAPKKGVDTYLIISHDIVGCYTHFVNHRTTPCAGHGCSVCEGGRQPEWHGYLAAIQSASNRRTILEVTKIGCKPLDEQFRSHRTMRGTLIQIGRNSTRENARTFVTVKDWNKLDDEKMKAPNVMKILASMWRLQERPLLEMLNQPAVKLADTGTDGKL